MWFADEALALVEELNRSGLGTVGATSGAGLATLESLPHDEPSAEHRRTLAALLEEAITLNKDNFKSACDNIAISENTLRCLRKAEIVSDRTWSRARNYVRDVLSKPQEQS